MPNKHATTLSPTLARPIPGALMESDIHPEEGGQRAFGQAQAGGDVVAREITEWTKRPLGGHTEAVDQRLDGRHGTCGAWEQWGSDLPASEGQKWAASATLWACSGHAPGMLRACSGMLR
jgi:hypothetical protein